MHEKPKFMPPEHSHNERNEETRSSADGVKTNDTSHLKTISPPPFQLKSNTTPLDKEGTDLEENSKGKSTSLPPPDTNTQPFQLKSNAENSVANQSNPVSKMENTFNHDFSKVNIHKDSSKASEIGARAYTQGNDIHFANGQYQPNTSSGDELLAHELTHVVQQSKGRVKPTTTVNNMPVNDDHGLEQEADQMAKKAIQRKAISGGASHKKDTSMAPSQTIQRWEWPWNWGGGEKDKGKDKDKDKDKDKKSKLKTVKSKGFRKGTNFNSKVGIPGPSPAMGAMDVTLRIKVNFLDCDMTNIKKHAIFDKANFKTFDKQIKAVKKKDAGLLKWDKASKTKFKTDYQSSITNVWSTTASKLAFKLNDKDYEKYQVNNNINLKFTDKNPHETINTIKMLPVMGRLRSYRGGEDLFDSRDVSLNETRVQPTNHLVEQIGEFDSGSAKLNAPVMAKINTFNTKAKAVMKAHAKDTPTPLWNVEFRGRSSSEGNARANKKISTKRAINVQNEVWKTLNTVTAQTWGDGEENTDTDTKYRRVEAILQDSNTKNVSQNVAAHETGHMFGLGDEYADETTDGALKKSTGDEADDTSQAIRDAGMGEAIVDEHRINQNNDSIMNGGSKVMVGHYSVFLLELKKIATDAKTGAEVNWQVMKI